ncbi:MAG TPA: HDOD domain-containing protein [Terriglobia bacterium]|nr:HDOD domain-containing protein [Terriglobia bacterium]
MSKTIPTYPNETQAYRAIVARQPICDGLQRTVAYELLFRDLESEQCNFGNGDDATSRVVFNAIVEIGLGRLVGPLKAFINFTRDFILGPNCGLLPRNRVVLEILEDSIPDAKFLSGLAALRARGYRFAMDDFNFQEQLLPFLPYCSYIKVDVRQVDLDRLIRELPSLRRSSAALVAEKVESVEEFEFYRSLGFEYFQGYFFCKPNIVSATTMPTNRMTLCKLVSRLQHADVTIEEVESIMGEDPSLSYRLLRHINSAAMAIPRKIESIKHAVRMVGLDHIRTLSSMVMLSSLEDKPRELLKTSVIRARMCQLLGEGPSRKYGVYFTAGLFSTLDAFLNCSMETALELLPLSDEIREALLAGKGPIGNVLAAVLAFEQADWGALDKIGIDSLKVASSYLDAIRWGEELLH